MLVGIKFCGGCRAAYDRKAEASAAISAVNEMNKDILFVPSPGDEDLDALLVVCGCRSRCVDISPYNTGKLVYINGAGDAAEAAASLALSQ